MGSRILSVQNVTQRYGQTFALDNVSIVQCGNALRIFKQSLHAFKV